MLQPFRAAMPAMALAVLLMVPFLGKAFTIDDTLFLAQADHLLSDPLHPGAFDVVWTETPERMSKIMPSGPTMAYLLVPCVALSGSEWVAHGLQLGLLLLAIAATTSLAVRLGASEGESRAASILLATAPTALALTGTAMPDIPAMAFGVWGVERALAWRQEGRWHQAVLAPVALAAASLGRSHLALLIGVAVAFCLVDQPRPKWISWAPLAACPVLIFAALLATRDPQATATTLAEATRHLVFVPNIPGNAIAYLTHWVFVLPLGLPWMLLHARRILTRPTLYVASAAVFVFLRASSEASGPTSYVVALIAGLGAAVIGDLLLDAARRRDGVRIVLGIWILVPLATVPYVHVPSKYLLAAAPAAAILVARELKDASHGKARAVVVTTAAYGLILAILILRADAVFAGLGRRATAELIAPQIASGKTVWFTGHWGFQWYAQKAGARPLTVPPPHPMRGDLVVSCDHSGGEFVEAIERRTLIGTVTDSSPGGRIMSKDVDAGFYSNRWGYLPWAWGEAPADRYDLWTVD